MSRIRLRGYFRYFIATLFVTQWLICSSAHALSPMKGYSESKIRFAHGSSTLTEEAKASLGRHLSCIETIALDVIIVVAYGDTEASSKADQLRVAANRSTEIRAFFLNAGVLDKNIYSEARIANSGGLQSGELTGIAIVETAGNCRSTASGKDCRILCRQNH